MHSLPIDRGMELPVDMVEGIDPMIMDEAPIVIDEAEAEDPSIDMDATGGEGEPAMAIADQKQDRVSRDFLKRNDDHSLTYTPYLHNPGC